MTVQAKFFVVIYLAFFLIFSSLSTSLIFAQEEAASFPPDLGTNQILKSTSAQFVEGWNFFEIGFDGCSAKNILDELQATGGSALNVANLFVKDESWQPYSFATSNASDIKIPGNKLLAFNSNQKFYLELNQKNCTNPNSERLNQIEQVRDGGATKASLVSRLSELPIDLWTKLITLLNKDNNNSNSSNNFNTNLENLSLKGRTKVVDLGITGMISQGLLSVNGLSDTLGAATINTLSGDLYLQNEQLGGANFLNGKVTIDKKGNLKVSGDVTADTVTAKIIRADSLIVSGSDQLFWLKVLNDRITVDKDGNLKITTPNLQVQRIQADTILLNGGGQVLTGTTGNSFIPNGQLSVDVNTDVVTDSSKVFITPRSGRADTNLSVLLIQNGKFTVSLLTGTPAPEKDIHFDYLIIK